MMLRKKLRSSLLLMMAALIVWPLAVHYRAKWLVEWYKRELRAAGEKLTIAELAPVTDASLPNAADSLSTLAREFNFEALTSTVPAMRWVAPGRATAAWREETMPTMDSTNVWPEVEEMLTAHQPLVRGLRAAMDRPRLVYQLDYQQASDLLLPHLGPTKWAAVGLSADTLLALRHGRTEVAQEDLAALTRLAERFKDEPTVISALVRFAIADCALRTTWEALQAPGWSDARLAELQHSWEAMNFLAHAETAMWMERAWAEKAVADFRRSYTSIRGGRGSSPFGELAEHGQQMVTEPRSGFEAALERYPRYWAWVWRGSYEDDLVNLQLAQAFVASSRAISNGLPMAEAQQQLKARASALEKEHPHAGDYSSLVRGGSAPFFRKVEVLEIERVMVATVLALERYRLRHGQYPQTLEHLAPALCGAVPRDPMDGKPLRYRLNTNGSFLLYSVGLDGEDNGGDATPVTQNSRKNYAWGQGRDAVWPRLATLDEVKQYSAELAQRREAEKRPRYGRSSQGMPGVR
jgi:hypothetical protein